MKTLFVIIFLLANGDMKYGVKQFDDTPTCVAHLEEVAQSAQTPAAKEQIEKRGVVNIISFCTTQMREVNPNAITAKLRPSL